MNQTKSRILSLMLAFVLVLSLFAGIMPMQAAAEKADIPSTKITTTATGYTKASDVKYVKNESGKYIYNWGARNETSTFLSTYAEAFYTNTTADQLFALSGGTSTETAPTSELYTTLQNLMKTAHTYVTTYEGTKDLYCYTDCVSSDTAHLKHFYTGGEVGSSWVSGGTTFNREHVWPDSKCLVPDAKTNDSADIMMLRPENPSNNSSRGNTAFGTSSNFFDPGVSVRGDVARILLYVYVRWGNTSKMWGSSGVIESLDILLQWMEEDPVDTWEMGRNDAVESITGTRNVFVDYPELAWQLFGKEIPADMTTPSGYAVNSACNHEHDDNDNGTHYDATCTEAAYTLYNCTNGNHTYKVYYKGSTKLDHEFDNGTTVPATCTTKGYTLYTCQRTGCGYTKKENETDGYAGHQFSNDVCSVCGIMTALHDGDQVVIYAPAYNMALSSTVKASYYKEGVDISNGIDTTDTSIIWTVTVNADGSYTFTDVNSKALKVSESYNSLSDESTYKSWTLATSSEATVFYLKSQDRNNDVALEWYESQTEFSAFNFSETDPFKLSFHLVTASSTEPVVCNHSDYTTVEAVTATCTTAGHVKYYQCNSCKKYNTDLTNADGWNSTKPAEAKDSANHTGEEIWALKDSTGHQQAYSCCGANAGEKAAHTYGAGDNSNTCTICGYVTSTGTSTSSSYFEKVTTGTLTSGSYILICDSGYAPTKLSGNWVNTAQPTVTDGKIAVSTETAGYTWILTVTENTVTLCDSNGKYIAPKGGNNNGIEDGTYDWSYTFDGEKCIFAGTGSDTVTFASNKGTSNKFKAYKNTTVSGNSAGYLSKFTLYKLVCTHSLLQEKVADEYLKSAATCGSAAVYYKSCESCGEKSTETFTVGQPTGKHTLTHHDDVPATCTKAGTIEYWSCSVCESNFSDANGTTIVSNITAPAKGHDTTKTHHNAKPADCQNTGYIEYWQCESCKGYFASESATESVEWSTLETPVDSSNHTYVLQAAVEANCTTASVAEHYKCSVCNKLFVKNEDSTYTEKTLAELTGSKDSTKHASTETKLVDLKDGKHQAVYTCCDAPAGDAMDHTFGTNNKCECGATNHTTTFVAAKDATCTEDGNIAYWYCSHCNKNFEDENATTEITGSVILPKGHTLVIDFAKAATCTTAGRTSGTHCLCCNYKTGGQVIPALGHTWGTETVNKAATCTENGSVTKTCSVCDLTVNETIVAKGHTEVIDAAKAATCTESGLTEGKHCSVCNTVFVKQETIAALGHKWDNGQQTTAATCTTDGTKTFTCSACKLTREETIAALGHKWDNGQQTAAATCTTDGTKTFTCASCLETRTEKIAASGSHTFGDWYKSAKGEERRICSACGEKETRTVEESSSVTTIVIIVASVAVLGGAAAAAYVFLFKKKSF